MTRFNVPSLGFSEKLNEKNINLEDYWRLKLKLFERICLPSVIGSVEHLEVSGLRQNYRLAFRWVILIGEENYHVAYLRQITSVLDWVSILQAENLGPGTSNAILKETASTDDIVVTVRLDVDDAINKKLIYQVVRKTVESFEHFRDSNASNLAFSFVYGSQLSYTEGQWTPMVWSQNPFSFAIARYEGGSTQLILQIPHQELSKAFEYRDIYTYEPMWLQVVDVMNVMNSRGSAKKPWLDMGDDFLRLFSLDYESLNRERGLQKKDL